LLEEEDLSEFERDFYGQLTAECRGTLSSMISNDMSIFEDILGASAISIHHFRDVPNVESTLHWTAHYMQLCTTLLRRPIEALASVEKL
jgi:hypothetical protein